MMDVIEILYNQYRTKTKLYVTCDAVAWHNSGPFLEALDQFNEETRTFAVGPIIELVPLPTSSQFLNVIEGVLSGMTRAVINNSDYPDAAQINRASQKHSARRKSPLNTTPGGSVRKSGRLISFKILMNFELGATKIRRYYKRVCSLRTSSQ